MASFFIKQGQFIRLESKEAVVRMDRLPTGTYVVQFNPMGGFFYLEPVDVSPLPKKIYGNHQKDADRILNTFLDRPRSTGVLLSGEKGSGKTMLTRMVSHDAALQDIPTLIVNAPYTGDAFNSFLSEIEQPCVVLFDEFEKVYIKEEQSALLTLLDGLVKTQKLYVLTTNDKYSVSFFMRNRPGRLFYMLEYTGLTADFIREYCVDNLRNKDHIDSVVAITHLFLDFNFDMLQALIEEMNRYNETASDALRLLNVKPDTNDRINYEVTITDPHGDEVNLNGDNIWPRNPMLGPVTFTYGVGDKDSDGDFENWKTLNFTPDQIVSISPVEGKLKMRNNEGYTISLVKEKPRTFDMGAAYRVAEGVAL